MAGRIITLQRQARELGRLRAGLTGTTSNGKTVPKRSRTWILTTHQRAYLDEAAEIWGGTVEEWQPQGGGAQAWRLITDAEAIDAILPPGDPLSQSYEMWSKGGCQRRCDGETEQLSGKPCLCREQFGDEFHLQSPYDSCRPHTRLNVVLPDVPDLGVWRMETKGFYAANEITASVDMIRAVTGGATMIPVRLRIEPRKRVAQGKTKQYPVIVVEIRGATAGQILSGATPAIELSAPQKRRELAAGPDATPTARGLIALVKLTRNVEQLNGLPFGDVAKDDPDLPELRAAYQRKLAEFNGPPQPEPATDVAESVEPAVEAEIEPDPDEVWSQIMSAVPGGWGTDGLEQRVIAHLGKSSIDANGFELYRFLGAVKGGEVA